MRSEDHSLSYIHPPWLLQREIDKKAGRKSSRRNGNLNDVDWGKLVSLEANEGNEKIYFCFILGPIFLPEKGVASVHHLVDAHQF